MEDTSRVFLSVNVESEMFCLTGLAVFIMIACVCEA
jgi:hypothetical protein